MTPARRRLAQAELEYDLALWAVNQERRDSLLRRAYAAGIPKHRIHVLTGVARTTIDRVLDQVPGGG